MKLITGMMNSSSKVAKTLENTDALGASRFQTHNEGINPKNGWRCLWSLHVAGSYKISVNYLYSNNLIDPKKPPTLLLSCSGQSNVSSPITSGVFLTLRDLQTIRKIVNSRLRLDSQMITGRLHVSKNEHS